MRKIHRKNNTTFYGSSVTCHMSCVTATDPLLANSLNMHRPIKPKKFKYKKITKIANKHKPSRSMPILVGRTNPNFFLPGWFKVPYIFSFSPKTPFDPHPYRGSEKTDSPL